MTALTATLLTMLALGVICMLLHDCAEEWLARVASRCFRRPE